MCFMLGDSEVSSSVVTVDPLLLNASWGYSTEHVVVSGVFVCVRACACVYV